MKIVRATHDGKQTRYLCGIAIIVRNLLFCFASEAGREVDSLVLLVERGVGWLAFLKIRVFWQIVVVLGMSVI